MKDLNKMSLPSNASCTDKAGGWQKSLKKSPSHKKYKGFKLFAFYQ